MNPRIYRKERLALELRREWGVHHVPWLWGVRLKILIVIDGSIDLTTDGFGIGLLIDILRDPLYAWWVDFDVDIAERGPAAPAGPHAVTYLGFRFDQPGFDLDAYHQVWLFGYNPGNDAGPDSNIANPAMAPLSDAELVVLAEWMDNGGGVFATGDHDYLGASMCSRIPRVRSMRKWTNAQGVPPIGGPTRLDTNQPANAAQAANVQYMPFSVQGDAVPQPIEVVKDPLWDLFPWLNRSAPHPILCTRTGIIDVFPDHPHEGEIIDDGAVALDSPLGITGYTKVEYPGGAGRPTPMVIAYGRTTHLQTNRVKAAVDARRFGLVGVYDGDDAGIGRVVVDSTWHHWFSENLVGFRDFNQPVYELMKAYFRNVALWLATPTQRANMLAAATWGVVVGSGPMEFPVTAKLIDLGERARDVIGRTAPQCTITDWVRVWLDVKAYQAVKVPPDPCLTCPPWGRFEHVIIGGIAKKLVEVAFPMQEQLALGARPIPDPKAISAAAVAGARLGHQELVQALADGGRVAAELSRATRTGYRKQKVAVPEFRVTDIRVVVESVRWSEPGFDSAGSFTFSVYVDDSLVAELVIDRAETPSAEGRGTVVSLGHLLAELTVWRGSEVSIEVDARGTKPRGDTSRATLVLGGDPREWPGAYVLRSDDADAWRLLISAETVSRQSRRGTGGRAQR